MSMDVAAQYINEPPSSGAFPHPPVSHEPRIQALSESLAKDGLHPFHLPLGILLDEKDGKPTPTSICIRCDAFDGFPCLLNGKADAQVVYRGSGAEGVSERDAADRRLCVAAADRQARPRRDRCPCHPRWRRAGFSRRYRRGRLPEIDEAALADEVCGAGFASGFVTELYGLAETFRSTGVSIVGRPRSFQRVCLRSTHVPGRRRWHRSVGRRNAITRMSDRRRRWHNDFHLRARVWAHSAVP